MVRIFLASTVASICPGWIASNGNGLAKWQAFYAANSQNYVITIDETVSYLSSDTYIESVLVEGSLEKIKQSSYVSERIVEWRDAVNEYNSTIASMQYWNGIPFTGVLVPDGVEDMKLLVISEGG